MIWISALISGVQAVHSRNPKKFLVVAFLLGVMLGLAL